MKYISNTKAHAICVAGGTVTSHWRYGAKDERLYLFYKKDKCCYSKHSDLRDPNTDVVPITDTRWEQILLVSNSIPISWGNVEQKATNII